MKKWTLAFLLSSPAFAGDLRFDINLASEHFVDTPGTLSAYNERNYGFGLEYGVSDKYHLVIGEYQNSINDISHYAGIGRIIKSDASDYFWERYEFGVELGIANGYKDFISEDGKYWSRGNDFSLMGGPYLRLGGKHALKLRYAIVLVTAGYQYEFR